MFWKRDTEYSKGERFPQKEPNTHNSKFSKMMSPERTKDFRTLLKRWTSCTILFFLNQISSYYPCFSYT